MKLRWNFPLVSLLLLGLLLSACAPAADGTSSSTDAQAWIDQPPTNALLPLAPFTLKAHASRPGGGIRNVSFLVNAASVGTVATNPVAPIVYAELEWTPPAPGEYFIQAQAFTANGYAFSEVARVCVLASVTEPLVGFLGACDDIRQPSQLIPPTSTPLPAACTGTVRQSLTVRTGPGTIFPASSYLAAGDPVDVIGRSADGEWLLVAPRDGSAQGWVSAKAIALNCDPASLPKKESPPTPTPTDEPPTPLPFSCFAAYGASSAACSADNRCSYDNVAKICVNK